MHRTAQQFSEPHQYNLIHGLTSLTRVMLKLGVLDRERTEFWRFLTQSFSGHRHRFAESVRLAAMGYHFRKLSDAYGKH
jgi:hypothetical protein